MRFKSLYFTEKKGVSYSYSSTQVDLPKDIADEVIAFGKELSDDDVYTNPNDASYGREDNIHATVLYGIHTCNVKAVERLVKDVKPFTIKLDDISFFDSEDYKVMKIDVKSKELHDLNAELRDNLKYTSNYPDYHPHVTIAYMCKDYDDSGLDVGMFKGREVEIDSIVFSPNDGERTTISLRGSNE